jgi:hypothetical protein
MKLISVAVLAYLAVALVWPTRRRSDGSCLGSGA